MTMVSRLGRLFLLVLTASALAQNPPLTTVSDTVFQANGQPATGVLLISWPAFTTSGGSAVAGGETTTTLGANGALSVQLVPNTNATPAETYYTVVYQLSDGVRTEYWMVPATSPATLSEVRTVLGAANGASQMASQQYVQNEVAGKANDSAVVHLAGSETITGVKQFSVSPSLPTPVNPGDAASKQYVDNSVQNSGSGSYVSIAGATMTGPLVLSGPPTAPSQAATKNYVDLGMASKADLVSGTVPLTELGPVAT
jgi:trimeric autotransporter adhesin